MDTFYVCGENCLFPGRGDCIYWILFDSIRFDPNRIVEWVGQHVLIEGIRFHAIGSYLVRLVSRIESMSLDLSRFAQFRTYSDLFHSTGFDSIETLPLESIRFH